MTETAQFICPVCGGALAKNNNAYTCCSNHSFDISNKGYVNLLLSHKMGSKEPGDNKQMVLARNAFLNSGYYRQLSDAINSAVMEHVNACGRAERISILDCGCGEGYYLDCLEKELSTRGVAAHLFGIDLSKEAVRLACSRNRNIHFAIANSFEIPLGSSSVDCLMQVFAPCSNDEFSRVMKDSGILISVIPGKKHLFGLKELLYDNPYENDEQEHPLTSFMPISQTRIEYDIRIENSASVRDLLMMTPYYWRTDARKLKKLEAIERLETPVEFIITTYTKKQGQQA